MSRDNYLKNAIHIYEKYKDVINDMEIIPEPILQPLIFAIHFAAEIERDKLKSTFTLL